MLDKLAEDEDIRTILLPRLRSDLDDQIAARQKLLKCLGINANQLDCKARTSFLRNSLTASVAGFRLALALARPPKSNEDRSLDPNIELPGVLRPNILTPLNDDEMRRAKFIRDQIPSVVRSEKKFIGGHFLEQFHSENPRVNALSFDEFTQSCQRRDRLPKPQKDSDQPRYSNRNDYLEECRRYEAYQHDMYLDVAESAKSAVARIIVENPMVTRFATVPITDKQLTTELSATAKNLQDYREEVSTMDPGQLALLYPDQMNEAIKGHLELCDRLENRFIKERSSSNAKDWALTLLKVGSLGGAPLFGSSSLVPLVIGALYSTWDAGKAGKKLTTQQELYSSFDNPSALIPLRKVQEAHTDFILSVATLPVAAAAASGMHTLFGLVGKWAWCYRGKIITPELESAIANSGISVGRTVLKETAKNSIDETTSNALTNASGSLIKATLTNGIVPEETYVYDAVFRH